MQPTTHASTGRKELAESFRFNGCKRIAEIGVERGVFTKIICQMNPQAKVFAIDPWRVFPGYRDHVSQERLDEFYAQTIEKLAPFNCKVIRKTSMEALEDFEDESLDAVYIDANHAYEFVKEDIAGWMKKVKKGGIVSGHDYIEGTPKKSDHPYGVIQAVNELDVALTIWEGDRTPSWSFFKK